MKPFDLALRSNLLRVGAVAVLSLVAASPAAAFDIESFASSAIKSDGSVETQAGAHPYALVTDIDFTTVTDDGGSVAPDGNLKTMRVDLPRGFVGDPSVGIKCTDEQLDTYACPADSQVGTVAVRQATGGTTVTTLTAPLYNLEPPAGAPAAFGFTSGLFPIHARVSVRTGADYGLTFELRDIPQPTAVIGTTITLWGVPADHGHDPERGETCLENVMFGKFCLPGLGGRPSAALPLPFLTNPSDCSAGTLTTAVSVGSWQEPGQLRTATSESPDGVEGCDRLSFEPSLRIGPADSTAGAPAAYVMDLHVPQNDNPSGLATPPLRKATVTLPAGTTVSPSSTDGLGACSPAQIGLASAAPAECPASSRLGDVTIETPVLDDPMTGAIFLATPRDNPTRSLVSVYLVAEGSGVRMKLSGGVALDPSTGRIEATFDGNPQLPFSDLRLRFRGGDRAPLANPSACGTSSSHAELTPWSSGAAVAVDDPMTIDQGCDEIGRFAPSTTAGLVSPVAGGSSAFVMDLDRPDRQQNVSGIDMTMPPGLLAKLRGVPLCGEAAASTGGCGDGSRVGQAVAAVGPGSSPFYLPAPGKAPTAVYLAGPYKGAPYSLVVKVPAQAGPFDLGDVVVRVRLLIDPDDAHVRVVADPLPQILEGIPLDYRKIRVTIDRPRFMVAPTSCDEMAIDGTIVSDAGAEAGVSTRFQVGDCASLAFAPRLGMRLLGKGRTRTGAHPALRTVLTQSRSQANIGRVKVSLPRSIALDARNTTGTSRVCDYDKAKQADCPASSIVGRAVAYTPLLDRPLAGRVHLVQGVRFGPQGNRIRATPSLLVKLRGEVAIDLRARTTVQGGRLVAIFPRVPDAPISRFSMTIHGGRNGILVVTRSAGADADLCGAGQTAKVKASGQNGKQVAYAIRVGTPCTAHGKGKGS